MNISVTRAFLMIVGGALIGFGAWFLIQAIPTKDWLMALFSIVGIAVGFALFIGKGINVSQ